MTEGAGIAQAAARALEFGTRAEQGRGVLQHGAQPLGVDRFGDVIVGSQAHRLDRTVDGALGGNQDHRHSLSLVRQALQQFDAAHARHLEVGNDDGRVPPFGFLQPVRTVSGSFSAIAPGGNQFSEPGALVLFIFHDQYFFLAHSLVLALVLVWPFLLAAAAVSV